MRWQPFRTQRPASAILATRPCKNVRGAHQEPPASPEVPAAMQLGAATATAQHLSEATGMPLLQEKATHALGMKRIHVLSSEFPLEAPLAPLQSKLSRFQKFSRNTLCELAALKLRENKLLTLRTREKQRHRPSRRRYPAAAASSPAPQLLCYGRPDLDGCLVT